MNNEARRRRILGAVFASLVAFGMSQAHAELYVTIEIQVNEGMSSEFIEFINEAAVDTRAFDGCQYFAILVDDADPHRVIFYEVWDSADDLTAYRAWRNETNFGASMGPFLAGPPVTRTFSLASD